MTDAGVPNAALPYEHMVPDRLADIGLARHLEALRADPPPYNADLGAAGCRARYTRVTDALPPGPDMYDVDDFELAGDPAPLHVRLYRPAATTHGLLVYLHGGGWTIGSLDSHDRICRRLAAAAHVSVLAVDYRLAPEHPHPAAVEDADAAVRWAYDEGAARCGSDAVGIGGDSAGGHLATLACLRLRDQGQRLPSAQILAYPNTDLTASQPSMREKATGWGLRAVDVAWFAAQWVPEAARRRDPDVSPLFADLTGLPPAVVVSCEHDPLRDEAEAYAARLTTAGVAVTARREPGLLHGFLNQDAMSASAAAAGDRLFADVAALLGPAQHAS